MLARDDRDVVVDLLDDRARPVADVVADQDLVERSLAELTEAHRVVPVLREICQLDYAEIADVLGLPVGRCGRACHGPARPWPTSGLGRWPVKRWPGKRWPGPVDRWGVTAGAVVGVGHVTS